MALLEQLLTAFLHLVVVSGGDGLGGRAGEGENSADWRFPDL